MAADTLAIPSLDRWLQHQVTAARGLSAAGPGRVRARSNAYGAADLSRLTAGWTTQPESADALIRRTLRTLRARSREQVASNDYGRRFIMLLQSNVLGAKGIRLESKVADPDGTADTQARSAIESAWKRWGEDAPEVTRTMGWAELERLILKTAAEDGEFLIRFREGRDAGAWAFQVQLLDPELMDLDFNVDSHPTVPKGNRVRTGVEVDAWGAPVAYHLLQSAHGQTRDPYSVSAGKKHVRVPVDEILHGFVVERVGQRRGIPWTATSLERLKILSAYEEAALTHARTGAQALGFFTREPGATGFAGDEEGSGAGDTYLNLEPGEFANLPVGVGFAQYDPKYPAGEFGPFVDAILKGISAGLGPAYTSLSQNLQGTSFAGGRMGLLEEREFYRYLQSWISGVLHRRLFPRWLRWALLQDMVTHPATGRPLPIQRLDKFLEHDWRGRRWPWVDPLKDAQAAVLMVQNDLATESQTLRELGHDPTEVWDERALELKEKAARGLTRTAPETPQPPTDDEEDPDGPLVADDTQRPTAPAQEDDDE